MSETLGDILRNQAGVNRANEAARTQAEIEAKRLQEMQDLQRAEQFFNSAKSTISENILKSKAAPDIFVGPDDKDGNLNRALGLRLVLGPGITEEDHPSHSAWVSFRLWALYQGLVVRWRREDSRGRDDAGFPEEHHFYLTVTYR